MTLVATFEPEFFNFGGTPTSLPAHTGTGTVVYIGALRNQQVAYCKSTKSGVINIGDIKGLNSLPDVYTRLANNKHKQYESIGIAWANHRCGKDTVEYRLIPDRPNRGLDFSAVQKPEIAIQFLFGFAAGALPLLDQTQSSANTRRAKFSDLQAIAMSNAVHPANWRYIFPNGTASFYERLAWLLKQVNLNTTSPGTSGITSKGYLHLQGKVYNPCLALPEVTFDSARTGLVSCVSPGKKLQNHAAVIARHL